MAGIVNVSRGIVFNRASFGIIFIKMKKRLVIIFVGIVIFIFVLNRYKGCSVIETIFKTRAVKARMHTVLQGIQLKPDGIGTVGDEQLALCRWYSDAVIIDDIQELGIASTAFDNWRKEAGIFYINDYTISEVKLEDDRSKKPLVFIVTGTIDFGPFIMRVPEGDTISWIQPPW
jgi:hypothetical protein